ncbi:hypothetical protein EES41_39805 (plasmid) [Streptomyces sp. ADI95-16]|nr:hypothetical protein EES41_39805 [Streptomyces sp. ADI95-16]
MMWGPAVLTSCRVVTVEIGITPCIIPTRTLMDSTEYDCQRITCGFAPADYEHDPNCMYREGPYCRPLDEGSSQDEPPQCC